jgi:isopentenyl-diphosphate Delta-isomerase
MNLQKVILVNEQDEQTGVMEKLEAHQKALLHRAFSVFIFNNKGEMLLQQRAVSKYHSPGLWSNACCSHPVPGEETQAAAQRRIIEELNIDIPLQKQFHFTYKAEFDNGLTEYEFDHVYTGQFNSFPEFNKEEVQDCCYKSMVEIKQSLQTHPRIFTEWFKIAYPEIEKWWMKNFKQTVVR